jgi:hypothetical protein
MPPGRNWPKRLKGRFISHRHKVEVEFGDPIRPREGEHGSDVMARVRAFYEAHQDEPNGARFARGRREKPAAERPPLSPAA